MIDFGSNFVALSWSSEYLAMMLLWISSLDQLFGGPLKAARTAASFR
jgi:hypothetical protein